MRDVLDERRVILGYMGSPAPKGKTGRIVVYGGGYIGSLLAKELTAPLVTRRIERREDIVAPDEAPPEIIVNAIGKTGTPNVDWCEDHKSESYFANVHVPYLLAEYARNHGAKLVHLSSGCVFEGDNAGEGFGEGDAPNFQGSYYSHTKVVAERLLAEYPEVLTLRLRMPISGVPGPRNLLSKLLSYREIIDVPNSITIVEDFLPTVRELIARGTTGIIHCVNPEPITHREILAAYEAASKTALGKRFIDPSELRVKAPRSNTILRTDRLAALGLAPRSSHERIREIAHAYYASEQKADA